MALTEQQRAAAAEYFNKTKGPQTVGQYLANSRNENMLRDSSTFVGRVKSALGERGGEFKETFAETFRGDISPVEFAFRTIGDVAGSVTDVIGAAIEPAVRPAIKKIGQTQVGADALSALASGMAEYEGWKKSSSGNERVAEMLESIINIADVAGISKAATVTGKVGTQIAKETAEQAGELAARGLATSGRIGAEVLGRTTGTGAAPFFEVFNDPSVIKYVRQSGKEGTDEVLEEALTSARKGLTGIKRMRSKNYQDSLKNLDLDVEMDDALTSVKRLLREQRDDLDTIVEGENVVRKAINDIENWDKTDALGMDKLKRRLDSYKNQLSAPGKSEAKRFVTLLKEDVRKSLNDTISGYENMTRQYRETSELIDEITRSLSLKDKAQKETTVRKLAQTLRRDDDTRRELLKALEAGTDEDIVAKISGALLGDIMPRGLIGRFAGALTPGALAAGAINPSFFVAMLPFLPMFSPRAAAEFVNVLGKINRTMLKSNRFAPVLDNELKDFVESLKSQEREAVEKSIEPELPEAQTLGQ